MKFETKEDLEREHETSIEICRAFKCDSFRKNPCPPYNVDISLLRGDKIVAFAEIRHRKKLYPTFRLSLQKYQSMMSLHRDTRLPVLYVIGNNGMLYYSMIHEWKPSFVWLERGDKRAATDHEPAVEVNIGIFKQIRN